MFGSVYPGSKVLVTGHTGFKGSWLCVWLAKLGCEITGVSVDVPTNPSHFDKAHIDELVEDKRCDLRRYEDIRRTVEDTSPDIVFHLAAQPLVRRSYIDPRLTLETNVLGTVNLLESLRTLNKPCATVIITSDKCYENVEWVWGYRETDKLGGDDPYSASKGAAELAIKGYMRSFFCRDESRVRLAVARAGNVVGGGDWADDRLIPDCVTAWHANNPIHIRSPRATRPWQHVLEPLSGYLTLAEHLTTESRLNGEAFNFGPTAEGDHTVEQVINEFGRHWDYAEWIDGSGVEEAHAEAGLLKLNCDKAQSWLGWRPVWSFVETMYMTADWYRQYLNNEGSNIRPVTESQIDAYCARAAEQKLVWTRKKFQ